jgi:hypothetical protein
MAECANVMKDDGRDTINLRTIPSTDKPDLGARMLPPSFLSEKEVGAISGGYIGSRNVHSARSSTTMEDT